MTNTWQWLRKTVIIGFWLCLWQAAAFFIDNNIILVGPVEVFRCLAGLLFLPDFWKSIAGSFGKISAGFLTAFFSGVLTGSLAWRFSFVRELLNPVISAVKSIPVASFVILSLIWIGSENLSVFIAFLVVFPMIYTGTIAGLSSTDKQLLEMAQVFSMPARKKLWYIYRPALIPYLSSSCNTALGMSWKSGIAAEVIGVPASSIGENLYMAKIYLSTEELFAWTLVIIVISALFEKLFLMLLNLAAPAGPQKRKEAKS